jgi:hypothetical protein
MFRKHVKSASHKNKDNNNKDNNDKGNNKAPFGKSIATDNTESMPEVTQVNECRASDKPKPNERARKWVPGLVASLYLTVGVALQQSQCKVNGL